MPFLLETKSEGEEMNKIVALFAALTAGLETAAAVYNQVVTHVPEPVPSVPSRPRTVGFVTAHAKAEKAQEQA